MSTFSIWEGKECGISLVRGASPPTFATGEPMDPGSVWVKAFEAASWNEACQVQHDHYGWGYYEPQAEWEEIGPDES
jgi:hypothetical protein